MGISHLFSDSEKIIAIACKILKTLAQAFVSLAKSG
jgi:hypothetical protein